MPKPFRSRYELIWEQLKVRPTHSVDVAAPAAVHARLRKAVIKRKDIDLGFKFQLSEHKQLAKLSFSVVGNVLRITLHIRSRLDDV